MAYGELIGHVIDGVALLVAGGQHSPDVNPVDYKTTKSGELSSSVQSRVHSVDELK